jgi:hypothetical protein
VYRIFNNFYNRINKSKKEVLKFVNKLKNEGATIAALGASTKGNIVLQFCELDSDKIDFIGEINNDKIGLFTPGTKIQIINEMELLSKKIDYLIVLPWHFKENFIKNKKYKNNNLTFLLPYLEVIQI